MPTARELSREDWKSYTELAKPERLLGRVSSQERSSRAQLLGRVRKAARLLKERFGVRRVILFGSLADDKWFRPDSDVDLAIEGLSPQAYWEAWRITEETIEDRTVDLIELEAAPASLRSMIEKHGIDL